MVEGGQERWLAVNICQSGHAAWSEGQRRRMEKGESSLHHCLALPSRPPFLPADGFILQRIFGGDMISLFFLISFSLSVYVYVCLCVCVCVYVCNRCSTETVCVCSVCVCVCSVSVCVCVWCKCLCVV